MKCVICGDEFVSKRSDAKTCSPTCRTKLRRQNKSQEPQKEEPKNISTRVKAKPACPEYMDANQYKRWEENGFAMCKFGECLDKDCRFRV